MSTYRQQQPFVEVQECNCVVGISALCGGLYNGALEAVRESIYLRSRNPDNGDSPNCVIVKIDYYDNTEGPTWCGKWPKVTSTMQHKVVVVYTTTFSLRFVETSYNSSSCFLWCVTYCTSYWLISYKYCVDMTVV